MKMKQFMSILLAALCIAGTSVNAAAQSLSYREPGASKSADASGEEPTPGKVTHQDSEAVPSAGERYKYLNSVSATIGRDGYTMECTGTAGIYEDYDVYIVVRLQREVNGKWTTVKSWDGTATRKGITSVSGSATVTKGYQYRAYTTAQVRDSAGRTLETAPAYSGIEYFL